MVKTIKFHIELDGQAVRTLDDLRENFHLQEVFRLYEGGVLERWLKVRADEVAEELEAVKAIRSSEKREVLEKLIEIFKVEATRSDMESAFVALEYFDKRLETYQLLKKDNFNWSKLIDSYHTDYEDLKEMLLNNCFDFKALKEISKELADNYFSLLKTDWNSLFDLLKEKSPTALIAFLANEKLREFFIQQSDKRIKLYDALFGDTGKVKLTSCNDIYKEVFDKIFSNNFFSVERKIGLDLLNEISDDIINLDGSFENISIKVKNYEIPNHLFRCLVPGLVFKSFVGTTDSYWKDLESGKKIMVLYTPPKTFVRSAGVKENDISYTDVMNSFPIVDGLDYKSNESILPVVYVEV